MVTTTITKVGDKILKVVASAIDTDTDESAEVDLQSEMSDTVLTHGYPTRVTLQAARSTGSTDTVSVLLLASNITTIYAITQAVATASSTTGSDWVEEHENVPQAQYWKIYCTTVGTTTIGNELTVTAVLSWV